MSLILDIPHCQELGKNLSRLEFVPDDFSSPLLYPPKGISNTDVVNFFFFITAIDHRTSTPEGKPFEALLPDSRFYHGADLLYALARLKQDADPQFFTPQKMSTLSNTEVKKWLSVKTNKGTISIREPEQRGELLRDLGKKMIKYGFTSALDILQVSNGYLKQKEKGLLNLLGLFKAYSDPLQKKSFLFLKFIQRRGLIKIKDIHNLYLPIDNHLIRIAIRTGLVNPKVGKSQELFHPQYQRNDVSNEADQTIRGIIRQAYAEVIKWSGRKNPTTLDDFFWILGRSHCLKYEPPQCEVISPHTCQLKDVLKVKCDDGCPLRTECRAFSEPERRKLLEHRFIDTIYY